MFHLTSMNLTTVGLQKCNTTLEHDKNLKYLFRTEVEQDWTGEVIGGEERWELELECKINE